MAAQFKVPTFFCTDTDAFVQPAIQEYIFQFGCCSSADRRVEAELASRVEGFAIVHAAYN